MIRIGSTEVNGPRTAPTGKASVRSSSLMAPSTRAKSRTSSSTVREELHTLIRIFTKVSGSTERPMAKEYSWIKMGQCMMVSGSTINNTASEPKSGTRARSSTQATSSMERRLEKESLSSKVATTRAISSTENSMARANTTLPIAERSTRVISRTIA